jgi:hypothetical protein
MQNNRELEALTAYLRYLAGKGASDDILSQRRTLLLKLLPALEGVPMDGNIYREKVDQVLEHLDRVNWQAFLAVVREYFYFWANDIKSIAAMQAGGSFSIQPLQEQVPQDDLRSLWQRIDQEKFELAETWPLKAYSAALRDEGAEKSVVETRTKLVKLLLVRLRNVEGDKDRRYRQGVDAALPLFTMKETRLLFLIVIREFYYFWIGDPDAASHIVLDAPEAQA